MRDTLVPVIFMSDATHLLNFTGDKKKLPVYMTFGHLSWKFRQMPSMHAVVMVTLLPIPINNCHLPQKQLAEQWQINQEVLNEVPWQGLHPLTWKQNPSAKSRYYNVLCVEGNLRRCKSVMTAWPAHCLEYSDLHHFKWHVWFWYECPKNKL